MGPRRCPRIYYSYYIKVVMKPRSYGVNERRYGLCWNGVCSRYAKFWVSTWHCFYRRGPIRRCLLLRIRQNSWFHWLEFSKERIFYLLYYYLINIYYFYFIRISKDRLNNSELQELGKLFLLEADAKLEESPSMRCIINMFQTVN